MKLILLSFGKASILLKLKNKKNESLPLHSALLWTNDIRLVQCRYSCCVYLFHLETLFYLIIAWFCICKNYIWTDWMKQRVEKLIELWLENEGKRTLFCLVVEFIFPHFSFVSFLCLSELVTVLESIYCTEHEFLCPFLFLSRDFGRYFSKYDNCLELMAPRRLL